MSHFRTEFAKYCIDVVFGFFRFLIGKKYK